MQDQFVRTRMLLGDDALERLRSARVCVFGVGGVGGYVVEALARAGVGALDLVDNDDVSVSNLNRQVVATWDTVGRSKVQVAAERVRSINPDCQVACHECFYLPETRDQFDFTAYDYVVDAVDTVTAKLDLVQAAVEAGTPVITCMGTGNKLDPTKLQVADISKTSVCHLARVMRKELRKRGINHVKCVFSTEEPLPLAEGVPVELKNSGRPTPGSVSFVPGTAGLIIASEVVKDLALK
ncbi:MAG: tRNA threonylcarbamoyladenosine dehydratase [Coriobacteriia bacterium]|nr:tRNA threonylcarbamoyladenosine dehydratase [Coriobacteriia bacterium]